MPSKKKQHPFIKALYSVEDAILISLLLIMIFVAVLQIILRNLFDSGLLWGDAFVRVTVLWIGLVGAMIASRNDHHISIDIVSKFLSGSMKKAARLFTRTFTCGICGVMTYFSYNFVLLEKQDGMNAFASVPAWICESIIPVAFGIMALRYFGLTLETIVSLFNRASS